MSVLFAFKVKKTVVAIKTALEKSSMTVGPLFSSCIFVYIFFNKLCFNKEKSRLNTFFFYHSKESNRETLTCLEEITFRNQNTNKTTKSECFELLEILRLKI